MKRLLLATSAFLLILPDIGAAFAQVGPKLPPARRPSQGGPTARRSSHPGRDPRDPRDHNRQNHVLRVRTRLARAMAVAWFARHGLRARQ